MQKKDIYNLIFGRFISNLGFHIANAAVLLFLVEYSREVEIPFVMISSVFGIFIGNWIVLPRISKYTSRMVLIFGNLFLGIILLPILIFLMSFGENVLENKYYFAVFILIVNLFSCLFSASSQQYLSSHANISYLHFDSTMSTISRVVSPILSMLLLNLNSPFIYIIFLNSIAAFSSALYFKFFFPFDIMSKSEIRNKIVKYKDIMYLYKKHFSFWAIVIVINIIVSTYNGGVLVHLKQLKIESNVVAVFMTIQYFSMFLASIITIKWPILTRYREIAGIFAGGGLLLIGIGKNIYILSIGNIILALGMTTLVNGFRSWIAELPVLDSALKRVYFGQLVFMSSLTNIFGLLIFSLLIVSYTSWGGLFLYCGAFVLISAFVMQIYAIKKHLVQQNSI
ncbi:hypothetical protein [Fluviispira vulneris]|uniref:hypothetical protein n=1 Tax=Fluviispira vulneris TaxID=2763012 RepID=UPI0016482B90|nr:hypothetical protein [Fluviispira vulneris]